MQVYSFIMNLGYDFEPKFDGKIHRFKVPGRNDKSGWFCGHDLHDAKFKKGIKILTVGDWSTGEKHQWCSKQRLNDYEKEKIDEKKVEIEKLKKEEQKELNLKAIETAKFYLKNSTKSTEFKYLKKKGITEIHNARLTKYKDKEFLSVPMYDKTKTLYNVHKIYADGSKKFTYGGRVTGCYHLISNRNENDTVYICEGWATGVSIFEATKGVVIAAIGCPNVLSVAKELKDELKDKIVYICSDNDSTTAIKVGKNPGLDIGRKAATLLNCQQIYPEFKKGDKGTDFNDFHSLYGLDELKKLLSSDFKEKFKYPWEFNGFYKIIDNGQSQTEKPDLDGLADYMIGEHHLKCDDSLVYMWSGKHYKSMSFLGLKNFINKKVKKETHPQTIAAFSNKAQIKSYTNFSDYKETEGYLNCNNGMLNLKTGKLEKHNPNNFIKYVLEHDYDPDADCKTFLKSLDLVTNGDKDLQLLIQMVFGYCIIGGHPKAHKAFMFYGEGGNGKSTILTALANLVGNENASRVPLTLFDKPFSMISLDGKLVNLIDETPKFNINPEAFKNVVSGGYVRAAHKRKPEVDLKINARIIFACNKLPNFQDDSDGMLRRLIVIPFNHRIPDEEADFDIDEKIKAEMPGVLNFAIQGLEYLIDNGYQFHKADATNKAIDQYKEETDSVYLWCKDNIEPSDKEDDYIFCGAAYDSYVNFCKDEEGLMPKGKRSALAGIRAYARREFKLKVESENKFILKKSKKIYRLLKCKDDNYLSSVKLLNEAHMKNEKNNEML